MKRAVLIFVVVAVVLILRIGAHAAPVRVTLSPRAEVQPARPVTVKDIARINGSKEAVRKVGEITVATGPMPGKSAMVESSYLRLRLKSAVKDGVTLEGSDRVELAGKCTKFAAQEIADQAKVFIESQLPQDGRTYETVIDRLPREIVVASGSTSELRPRLLNPTLQPGPKAVAVDIMVDQRVAASVTVALSVKATADVLVATKPIKQNEVLGPENTSWDRRDISKAPKAIVQGDSDPTGWVAQRGLTTGSLVMADQIAAPFTVRRGETAALTVTCGAVTLRSIAEVRQDARIGQLVRVRPAMSQEDLQAKVVGPGQVAIDR